MSTRFSVDDVGDGGVVGKKGTGFVRAGAGFWGTPDDDLGYPPCHPNTGDVSQGSVNVRA